MAGGWKEPAEGSKDQRAKSRSPRCLLMTTLDARLSTAPLGACGFGGASGGGSVGSSLAQTTTSGAMREGRPEVSRSPTVARRRLRSIARKGGHVHDDARHRTEGLVEQTKSELADAASVVQDKTVELKEQGRGKLGETLDRARRRRAARPARSRAHFDKRVRR